MHQRKGLWVGAVALVGFVIAGCGDDKPSVTITEADPVAERRSVTADTSALAPPDSILADSLVADTVSIAPVDTVIAPPDFGPFWTAFQASIRSGNVNAVTRFATLGEDGVGLANVDQAYIKAFTGPFKNAVLSLSPRDFERDETAREIRVVVGFNAEGRVVPEDEADTDEGIRLRFDVVNGRYRWVGFDEDA